jgi:hypothetical protein
VVQKICGTDVLTQRRLEVFIVLTRYGGYGKQASTLDTPMLCRERLSAIFKDCQDVGAIFDLNAGVS